MDCEVHRPHFRGVADEQSFRERRWCLKQTRRDARQAAARGRPISFANLRRLCMRRWARAGDIAADSPSQLRRLLDELRHSQLKR